MGFMNWLGFKKVPLPDPAEGKRKQVVLSLKGKAFIAAVETGLLPLTEKDGVTGYDYELFDRFWEYFIRMPGVRTRKA